LVLKYYPAKSNDFVGDYVSSSESLANEALAFELDPSLMAAIEKTCTVHEHGDVKMVYCTRGGPGPKALDPSESVFEFTME
jgi:hypothetical protein